MSDEDFIREVTVRFDPDNETKDHIRDAIKAAEDGEEIDHPEHLSVTDDEDQFDQAKELLKASMAISRGEKVYPESELVACPECTYEGSVGDAVFPGGHAHTESEDN